MAVRERMTGKDRKKLSDAGQPSATLAPPAKKKKKRTISWDAILLVSILISGVAYLVLYIYLSPTLDTLPPIQGPEYDNKQWGTYRPHTYFGLRTRDPRSPLFGMMWYEQPDVVVRPSVRHWCNQGDGISRYGWVAADGRTFGRQNITEPTGQIRINWLNDKGGFTSHVKFDMLNGRRYSLIFYLVSQDSNTKFSVGHHLHDIFTGQSSFLGDMKLSLATNELDHISHSSMNVDDNIQLNKLDEYILSNTKVMETKGGIVYMLNENRATREGRLVVVQLNVDHSFEVEVALKVGNRSPPRGIDFHNELDRRTRGFEKRFEEVFGIENKNYTTVQMNMAKVALSNMLGSLGFWHGYNKVSFTSFIQNYGPHSLFSAVPSRPFFPRGFLWDEGFHNMLIRKFDPKLSLEIIVSWMNTMEVGGWIPREMILGIESESKVPAEYITQHVDVANPPSLFYVIDKLVHDEKVVSKYGAVLGRIYPRLEKWYVWLRATQAGQVKNGFRWRGRNETTSKELNPKTLASGLDDYPRASHPSREELHLDLRCWMALCARVLERLSKLYGTDAEHRKYAKHKEELADVDELVKLHWSQQHGAFFDYGRHSENVGLAKVPTAATPGQQRHYVIERVTSRAPSLRLVSNVFGYNSLFPLMLRLLPADSDYFKQTLDKIRDPEVLWTEFGLRSLSRQSPYYQARNTEHDPPYWRGYIWININYMTLSALRHYADVDGPYKAEAEAVFQQLRTNLVRNMAHQFNRTGFIWENYDDRTGEGRGSHPFNGWSSLVLMIMSDSLET